MADSLLKASERTARLRLDFTLTLVGQFFKEFEGQFANVGQIRCGGDIPHLAMIFSNNYIQRAKATILDGPMRTDKRPQWRNQSSYVWAMMDMSV